MLDKILKKHQENRREGVLIFAKRTLKFLQRYAIFEGQ